MTRAKGIDPKTQQKLKSPEAEKIFDVAKESLAVVLKFTTKKTVVPLPETNSKFARWKWMDGKRLFPFWDGLFSGANF